MSNDEPPCLTRLVQGDDSDLHVAHWHGLRRQLTNSLDVLAAATDRAQQLQLSEFLLDFATEQVRALGRIRQSHNGVLT